MASDTEGIAALFSMYNDDEEDDEDADEPNPPSPAPPAATAPDPAVPSSPPLPQAGGEGSNPRQEPPSPPLPSESTGRKTLASPNPSLALPPLPSRRSSSPFAVSSPSPLRPPASAPPADLPRPPRRGALAIVDYAHDEMAMSPEQEDGEIMRGAHRSGSDVQATEGNLEERTLSVTVHIMTQNIQTEMPQHPDAPQQNQVETDTAMDVTGAQTEDAGVEETPHISTNGESDDPLSRFLPPPVSTKCSAGLQQKINKFLAYKRAGKSFNAEVRNRKDYRNPDFLQHAVRYQEIDQIGTCFSKDVFDPYGYDKSDYYDEIEADMKRELERKEQEKKKSPKVEFITGGVQPPISASIPKIPALAGTTALPVPAEGVQKETRPNKKSKWDKVDGDIKNLTGHDNLSATVSAALLTSANVGAGYAAFAQQQQKRKEAEEKRTDRRS
uniref:SAP30-binding protein n=1 Tax=Arundo donax TaxID=35708 RepID=A0A0A9CUN9_ARUDO